MYRFTAWIILLLGALFFLNACVASSSNYDKEVAYSDLIQAIKNKKLEKVKRLTNSSNINKRYGRLEKTPLIFAVSVYNNLDIIKFLLKSGADINKEMSLGCTPLIEAAQHSSMETVKILLDNGAKFKKPETLPSGYTALYHAVDRKKLDMTRLLLKYGAAKNIKGGYKGDAPILRASLLGYVEIIELLLEYGVKCNDCLRKTIWYHNSNKDRMIKLFLEKGVGINYVSYKNGSALGAAISKNKPSLVEKLIKKTSQESKQETFDQAWLKGDVKIVKALINRGIDIYSINYVKEAHAKIKENVKKEVKKYRARKRFYVSTKITPDYRLDISGIPKEESSLRYNIYRAANKYLQQLKILKEHKEKYPAGILKAFNKVKKRKIIKQKIAKQSQAHKRGEKYLKKHQYKKAIKEFNIAIKIDKKDYIALMRKGVALGALGRYDEAITSLGRSIALKKSAHSLFIRGMAYQKKKQFKKALSDYNASIKINPNLPGAWNNKGFAHTMLDITESGRGHNKNACIAFNKACKLGDCRLLNEFDHCKK